MAYQTPVRQLQAQMSSADFVELVAYSNLEPFDERRGDARASMIAATVANASIGRTRQFSAADFPVIDEKRQSQRRVPMVTRWKQFVAIHNERQKDVCDR